MRWFTKTMVLVIGIGLVWPSLSLAQPAGKTKSGEMFRGLVLPALNVLYFPIKLATGVTGAFLGGTSGFLTGGNHRLAEGIWHPMTGGSYFITPEMLDNEEPFLPFDYGPSAPPRTNPQATQPNQP